MVLVVSSHGPSICGTSFLFSSWMSKYHPVTRSMTPYCVFSHVPLPMCVDTLPSGAEARLLLSFARPAANANPDPARTIRKNCATTRLTENSLVFAHY